MLSGCGCDASKLLAALPLMIIASASAPSTAGTIHRRPLVRKSMYGMNKPNSSAAVNPRKYENSIVPSALAANDGAIITMAGTNATNARSRGGSLRSSAALRENSIASVANSSGQMKM